MEIFFKYDIQPNGSRYLIYSNDELIFTADYQKKGRIKRLLTLDNLLPGEDHIAYDDSSNSLLPSRVIRLYNSSNTWTDIFLKHQTFPDASFSFSFDSNFYQAIYHFGRVISIFKNGSQIAYYTLSNSSRHSEEEWAMKIVADDNIEKPLLILFCLNLYSDFSGESNDARGNPSFNIAFWSKKFDKNWKPNMI